MATNYAEYQAPPMLLAHNITPIGGGITTGAPPEPMVDCDLELTHEYACHIDPYVVVLWITRVH